jgi:hypothetical protein
VANTGSISGGNFFFAKPVRVVAGTDIKNIQLQDQNLTASDVTFFSAGRDFSFATTRDPLTGNQTTNNTGVYVAGPGFLEVEAGRNLSFGNSSGVVGGGNATNLVLPKTSAAISATAGATSPANYAAFLGTYVDPAGSGYVSDYAGQLSDYLASIGKSVTGLSDAQKLALFKGLGVQLQTPFVQKVFYNELTQSGLSAATQGETGYARGTNAINALFPAGGQYRGSLTMLFSQIRTKAGGDINIQVPGGDVNVGQTTQSAGAATKTVDKLGIVAEGAGSVHSYLSGNFNVNESRVFTLNGGDILVWSNEGNIDAGKGAKTATSSPPPTVITNPDGTTVFKFSSVSGSGIRGILTDRTLTPGDVTLVAPKGEVIAGDAGIGSAGNIVIAAVRVVGADNIQVAGQSTGVPTVQAVSPASGLAGASNVGSDAAKAAENATRNVADASRAGQSLQQNFRPSFVTVQVFCVGAACSQ